LRRDAEKATQNRDNAMSNNTDPLGVEFNVKSARDILMAHYDHTYVAPGEDGPRRTVGLSLMAGEETEAALEWIDRYGDRDHDGFVEYSRRSEKGLVQQGWKDSNDSVFHADGSIAEPPIALCEVQGYVYSAKKAAGQLAVVLGKHDQARTLDVEAAMLKERFEQFFWCPDLQMYALGLDGQKNPCRVRTSNPGHCLFSGIASAEHAIHIARALLAPEFFSGWGWDGSQAKPRNHRKMI